MTTVIPKLVDGRLVIEQSGDCIKDIFISYFEPDCHSGGGGWQQETSQVFACDRAKG